MWLYRCFSLRKCAFFAIASSMSFAGSAQAKWCEVGSQVTLQTKLEAPIEEFTLRGYKWMSLSLGAQPCYVGRIYSANPIPAGCAPGKTLEASGVVKKQEQSVTIYLEATSARCF